MKNTFLILLILFFSHTLCAQMGTVFDNLSMHSDILNMDRKYAVYLPPDYEKSQRSYPVLYLLHGGGDDQTGWVQFGEVLHIADKAINEGIATPMIIVMPDADAGRRGYFNDPKNNWRYEDFFFDEFIPFIEDTYPIKGEKQYRAVAGLSKGGGGSFMYALHHPEMFSSACPLSADTGPLSIKEVVEIFEEIGDYTKYTESEIETWYMKHSALELINDMTAKDLGSVRWYIDCGDDDFLFEGNSLAHIALRKKEVPHEFRIRDGEHTWTYWRASLPVVLEFISMAFHQH
jgi:enterochelin esterase-like enzyme